MPASRRRLTSGLDANWRRRSAIAASQEPRAAWLRARKVCAALSPGFADTTFARISRALTYWPWWKAAIPSAAVCASRQGASSRTAIRLMARIVEHQVEIAEAVAHAAFDRAEFQDRRRAGCDPSQGREPLGIGDGDLDDSSRGGYLFD